MNPEPRPHDYPFDGMYAGFCKALPGWSVDLNGGVDIWDKKTPGVSAFVAYDHDPANAWAEWIVYRGKDRWTASTRVYDGNSAEDTDALVADVVAALNAQSGG